MAAGKKKNEPGASPTKSRKQHSDAKSPSGKERDVGNALRSIYQKTVDESVPQEMIDLLGKLG